MDPGFNVFHLISDYYYRETFHGDIIAALLSPDEKHGEGNLYIDLFIKMINRKKQLPLMTENWQAELTFSSRGMNIAL